MKRSAQPYFIKDNANASPITVDDTGYTRLCPEPACKTKRYASIANLIGKPRKLELLTCPACIVKRTRKGPSCDSHTHEDHDE